MVKWNYPKYKLPEKLLEISDIMLAEYEKENKDCEEANRKIRSELELKRTKLISDAKEIYGQNSNVVKYLLKQRVVHFSTSFYDDIKSRVLKAREEEKKNSYNIERQKENTELTGKAIKFLIDRNKVINVDFDVSNAIAFANDIAYYEEIEKRQKELTESGSYIDFVGSDNCENCEGWNGEHRCQCGNRRVSWSGNDSNDFFLNPRVYGEAY